MENVKENINDLLLFYIKNNDYEVLLDKCKTLIKNPFILFDSSFTILISSDESIKNRKEIKKYGNKYILSLSDDNEDYDYVFKELKNSEEVYYKEYSFLDVPILIKRIGDEINTYGYFVVYLVDKNSVEIDKEYTEMISIVINHDLALRGITEKDERSICINILDGKYSAEEVRSVLKNITIRNIKKGTKRLAVIKAKSNKQNITYIMSKHNITAFQYKEDIVCINNSPDDIKDEILYEIVEQFGKDNIRIGISDEFDSLMDLSIAYKKANEAINIGNIFYPGEVISIYDNHLIIATIRNLDKKIQDKLIDKRIVEVIEHDKAHNSNFYKEMKVYFECGRNINNTAKALFQHKNSVYFHIEKIKETFNVDLENPDDCFKCELSIRVLDIINKQ